MDKIGDLKVMLRAAEMAPRVKYLLYKHQWLSLNSQNLGRKTCIVKSETTLLGGGNRNRWLQLLVR